MTAYAVAQLTIHDEHEYKKYALNTPPIVARYGGEFVTRGTPIECLEGTQEQGPRTVISKWPSIEAARSFYSDPDYLKLAKHRHAASTLHFLFLQEGAV